MKIIEPYFELLEEPDGEAMLQRIERIARVCYKSEDRIADGSARKFLSGILRSGHESVIEHEKLTVRIVCDRGVSHEIVRHRIASYSQESTRYCNYSQGKFGSELTLVRPCFWQEGDPAYGIWLEAMGRIEAAYMELLARGASPQEARAVLPNSLKTEIVVTMNLREWRHFFRLRTARRAHPQMRQIACMVLEGFRQRVPIFFDDIAEEQE